MSARAVLLVPATIFAHLGLLSAISIKFCFKWSLIVHGRTTLYNHYLSSYIWPSQYRSVGLSRVHIYFYLNILFLNLFVVSVHIAVILLTWQSTNKHCKGLTKEKSIQCLVRVSPWHTLLCPKSLKIG